MARDGSGTFTNPYPDFVAGTTISSTQVDANNADIAAALTASLAKDGQTVPTANLPMGTYRHTGVGNSAARTDYAATGQVQDGSFIWGGTAGGTADALTLTLTPAITAYAAGQTFQFISSASPNTGATTVAVSGLAAKAVQNSGSALTAGQIEASKLYEITYDGTAFQISQAKLGGTGDFSSNTGASVDGEIVLFSGTGGKTGKRATVTGILKATSGVIDTATDGTDILSSTTGIKQGLHTIDIPATAMVARTTSGAASGTTETATNKVMVKTLDFDAAADEFAQFIIRMPESWDEGTVTASFSWSSNVAGTNAVVWGLQAVALSDDDALDTAFGTAQTVTDAQTAQGDIMHTAATSAITIAGTPAAKDLVIFQVYRDADAGGDTLAGDARLHSVQVYYMINAATDA